MRKRPLVGMVIELWAAAIRTIPNRPHATSAQYGQELWCLRYRKCGELNRYGEEKSHA
jgi:hypothetical protein